jgi:rubredoxin
MYLEDGNWMSTLTGGHRGWFYYRESPDMRKCPKCKKEFGINIQWEDAPEGVHCPFCGGKVSKDNAIPPQIYTSKW